MGLSGTTWRLPRRRLHHRDPLAAAGEAAVPPQVHLPIMAWSHLWPRPPPQACRASSSTLSGAPRRPNLPVPAFKVQQDPHEAAGLRCVTDNDPPLAAPRYVVCNPGTRSWVDLSQPVRQNDAPGLDAALIDAADGLMLLSNRMDCRPGLRPGPLLALPRDVLAIGVIGVKQIKACAYLACLIFGPWCGIRYVFDSLNISFTRHQTWRVESDLKMN